MRVFNLTDVETAVLKQHALFNQHIAIGSRMSTPGEYIDVEDPAGIIRARLVHLLTVGAVSIDQVPPAYARAKQLAQSGREHPSDIVARHSLALETKVPVLDSTEAAIVASEDKEPELSPQQYTRGKKRTFGR